MVDFNNEWYRKTCKESGLNPDNILSQSAIEVAKSRAIEMKMYMDTKEQYTDTVLLERLDHQINRLNNERIEFMLNALTYAEVMKGMGTEANNFIQAIIRKREFARR